MNLNDTNNSPAQISAAFRTFFGRLGANVDFHPGKALFYNNTTGMLFVRATRNDMDIIENALVVLNEPPPQIHIKARFIYLPKGTVASFDSLMNLTNSASGCFAGILASTNIGAVLRTLESRKGAEMLAEPEVVTISGRQTVMRATQIITVVTNFAYQSTDTNGTGSVTPQVEQVETGPVLDVVPYVLADGYTINLTIIPCLIEFLGYDTPPDEHLSKKDTRVELPAILPRFSIRRVITTLESAGRSDRHCRGNAGK